MEIPGNIIIIFNTFRAKYYPGHGYVCIVSKMVSEEIHQLLEEILLL